VNTCQGNASNTINTFGLAVVAERSINYEMRDRLRRRSMDWLSAMQQLLGSPVALDQGVG